jgi:uncharacterized protein YjiS (DUF1127 family)
MEEIDQCSDDAIASDGQVSALLRFWGHLCDHVALWCQRTRERRHLAQLSDHMLRDIGIDRAQAWQETRKWFWHP